MLGEFFLEDFVEKIRPGGVVFHAGGRGRLASCALSTVRFKGVMLSAAVSKLETA